MAPGPSGLNNYIFFKCINVSNINMYFINMYFKLFSPLRHILIHLAQSVSLGATPEIVSPVTCHVTVLSRCQLFPARCDTRTRGKRATSSTSGTDIVTLTWNMWKGNRLTLSHCRRSFPRVDTKWQWWSRAAKMYWFSFYSPCYHCLLTITVE